ncbi:MAG: phosphoribosylformylglycinamidine synthase subunit PurQ [Alphaproteobacteria bacterium]
MRVAVIVFPGSNCDRDVAVALEQISGQAPLMVWHAESTLPKIDLIVLPGGFSYGDYLRCGAMAAHAPIMREVKARGEAGVPVLGICNGFQILCEVGLLPGALLRNAQLKFICRDVTLKVETGQSLYTNKYETGQIIRIPVAHADGNYFADTSTLNELEDENRIAFRYSTSDGKIDPSANPNGAARNIAGIFNKNKTILGLMPHPERACDPVHGGTDGRPFFEGLVQALAA